MFSQQMGKPKNTDTPEEKLTPVQAVKKGYGNPKVLQGEQKVLSSTGTCGIK